MVTYNKAYRILLTAVIVWFIACLVILHYISNINLFEPHDIAVSMLKTGKMKYFLNGQFNYNYQFPIYPYLLFLIYKIFGVMPKAGVVLNLLFHSLAVLLAMPFFNQAGKRISINAIKNNATVIALVASLAMLFHPLINYYALEDIHPLSADLFFLMLTLYSIMHYNERPNTTHLILLGIVFGLSILDRPTLGVCIIPFFISLKGQTNRLTKVGLVLGIGMLVLMPWLYRNYTIYNKLSLSSSTGQNLWIGIQEQTGGTTTLPSGDTYYKLISDSEWHSVQKLNSEEQSDYFMQKYRKEISNNPSLLLKMYLVKLNNFWLFRNGIGSVYNKKITGLLPIYKCIYLSVLLLAIGFILIVKKDAFLIFSIPLSLSLLQAVFYIETRHRIIIEPLLIFMAIGCLCIVQERLFRKKNA